QRSPDPFVADPIPPVPPLTASKGMVIEAPIGTIIVLIQWQGASVGKDPQSTYAADVFSDVLNQPNSGFQKRLVDSGLFQAVGVNYYTLNHVGPISVSGTTTPEKLKAALAALDKEIARFDDPDYFNAAEREPGEGEAGVGPGVGPGARVGFPAPHGVLGSVASLEYY